MKPLEGVRVIDYTTYVAGPTAALVFADLGAEVIKVEGMKGDPERWVGIARHVPIEGDLMNPYFDNVSYNKEFVSLNTRSAEGLEFLKKLIAGADIFITNYRAQALEALGLTYEQLSEGHPALVYGHVLGYGEHGPEKDRPGFDQTAYVARGGMLRNMTPAGSDLPIMALAGLGDNQTGLCLALGLLGAYIGSKVTGRGDKVTTSLYGTAIYMNKWGLLENQYGLEFPASPEDPVMPCLNPYKTRDGEWVMFCAPDQDAVYDRLVRVLGREDLIGHPVYSKRDLMIQSGKASEFTKILAEGIGKMTCEEAIKAFTEADLTLERGYSFQEIHEDEQAWANHYLYHITYGNGSQGITYAMPYQLKSADIDPVLRRSRALGADNDKYLKECGYTQEQIARMRAEKAIR